MGQLPIKFQKEKFRVGCLLPVTFLAPGVLVFLPKVDMVRLEWYFRAGLLQMGSLFLWKMDPSFPLIDHPLGED